MSDPFEALLVGETGAAAPVKVRLERGEVFVEAEAGASIVRLPASRVIELEVNSGVVMRGRHRNRTGMNVTLKQADGPLIRLRPVSTANAQTVFKALEGDGDALTKLNERGLAYRRFVLDLAREVKARGGRIMVGKRGEVAPPAMAALFVLVGAALIGWQAYEPKSFALYALGGAMLVGGVLMFLRTPDARPREVDGSEAALDAYLPPVR